MFQRQSSILADRTNGLVYTTVLRPVAVVCLCDVTLCIVAKRCVLEQKLLLTAYGNYEKSIRPK